MHQQPTCIWAAGSIPTRALRTTGQHLHLCTSTPALPPVPPATSPCRGCLHPLPGLCLRTLTLQRLLPCRWGRALCAQPCPAPQTGCSHGNSMQLTMRLMGSLQNLICLQGKGGVPAHAGTDAGQASFRNSWISLPCLRHRSSRPGQQTAGLYLTCLSPPATLSRAKSAAGSLCRQPAGLWACHPP